MKNEKKFDCVQMKNDIQARLWKEYEGMSVEEIRKNIHEKLYASNSPVGEIWRRMQSRENVLHN